MLSPETVANIIIAGYEMIEEDEKKAKEIEKPKPTGFEYGQYLVKKGICPNCGNHINNPKFKYNCTCRNTD